MSTSMKGSPRWKWLGGTLGAVLVWWLTQGAIEMMKPKPPQQPPVDSVTGYWTYTTKSNVSGNVHSGTITLTHDGSLISGVLEKVFDNSKTGLKGSISGDTVELTRDTGLDTIQTYRLRRSGNDILVGTFENVGKYPDNGSIELRR